MRLFTLIQYRMTYHGSTAKHWEVHLTCDVKKRIAAVLHADGSSEVGIVGLFDTFAEAQKAQGRDALREN